jgi:hypothetical protein
MTNATPLPFAIVNAIADLTSFINDRREIANESLAEAADIDDADEIEELTNDA